MMSITVKFNDAIQKVLCKQQIHVPLVADQWRRKPMSPLLSSLVNCTMTWLLDNTMVPGCCDPQYFPFVDEKNRNRLFILVCFFWLNVKELESLTFLRKNRFFLSKLYLWDCFGFRHRLWLGHTCNFHCPLVRICPQTPILCAKVNEFRFYLCTSILCF